MRSISKLSKGNVFAVIFSASFAAFHKYFGKVHSGKEDPAFLEGGDLPQEYRILSCAAESQVHEKGGLEEVGIHTEGVLGPDLHVEA